MIMNEIHMNTEFVLRIQTKFYFVVESGSVDLITCESKAILNFEFHCSTF